MPPKRKMVIKKISVLRDEMKIQSKNGLYAFLPFQNDDPKRHRSSIYKIGLTTRPLHERLEHYHSYFPLGVYQCAYLVNPTKLKKRNMTPYQYLEKIEDFLFKRVKELGSKYIYSTTRIKKNSRTEWVFTNDDQVHQAFSEAHEKWGGRLYLYHTNDKDDEAKIYKKKLKSESFTAEITYPTDSKEIIY